MKNRMNSTLASLFLLALITFTSSCSLTVTDRHQQPRHQQRTVWVGGVRYKQVYYVDSVTNNVVIVNQTEYAKKQPKQPKQHEDNGKHKGKHKGN